MWHEGRRDVWFQVDVIVAKEMCSVSVSHSKVLRFVVAD
jgi:hypothetical protein